MALGTSISADSQPRHAGSVCPVSLTAPWVTVIDAGGPAVQDAATIQNPDVSITAATRHIFNRGGWGTNILVRLGYDDGLTTITNPVIKVFGKTGSGAWQILPNKAGSATITLTTAAATDVTDGTLLYTSVDMDDQQIDSQGCEQILIGVQTALAGTGVVSNSVIQVKLI